MKNIRKIIFTISLVISSIHAQELCPVENFNVLGGDGQNILTWEEPANPFLVTFAVAITTDSWPTEISWTLVNTATGEEVASIEPGDLTNAGETYTSEFDIENGNYTFTICFGTMLMRTVFFLRSFSMRNGFKFNSDRFARPHQPYSHPANQLQWHCH